MVLGLSACVYRFSNLSASAPTGLRSLAFDPIFDPSREVIKHDLLWSHLQRAFAASAILPVVSRDEADGILRAKIVSAEVLPSANPVEPDDNGIKRDPALYAQTPPPPNLFRRLYKGRYMGKSTLTIRVEVELWNAKQERIFVRSYNEAGTFIAVGSSSDRPSVDFLRHEESLDATLNELTKRVAEKVVQDVFVR